MTANDAEFFRANPRRRYRLRLASADEVAMEVIVKEDEDQNFWWAAVKKIKPGVRGRFLYKAAPPPQDNISLDEIPEEFAREVFHDLARRRS